MSGLLEPFLPLVVALAWTGVMREPMYRSARSVAFLAGLSLVYLAASLLLPPFAILAAWIGVVLLYFGVVERLAWVLARLPRSEFEYDNKVRGAMTSVQDSFASAARRPTHSSRHGLLAAVARSHETLTTTSAPTPEWERVGELACRFLELFPADMNSAPLPNLADRRSRWTEYVSELEKVERARAAFWR